MDIVKVTPLIVSPEAVHRFPVEEPIEQGDGRQDDKEHNCQEDPGIDGTKKGRETHPITRDHRRRPALQDIAEGKEECGPEEPFRAEDQMGDQKGQGQHGVRFERVYPVHIKTAYR